MFPNLEREASPPEAFGIVIRCGSVKLFNTCGVEVMTVSVARMRCLDASLGPTPAVVASLVEPTLVSLLDYGHQQPLQTLFASASQSRSGPKEDSPQSLKKELSMLPTIQAGSASACRGLHWICAVVIVSLSTGRQFESLIRE